MLPWWGISAPTVASAGAIPGVGMEKVNSRPGSKSAREVCLGRVCYYLCYSTDCDNVRASVITRTDNTEVTKDGEGVNSGCWSVNAIKACWETRKSTAGVYVIICVTAWTDNT